MQLKFQASWDHQAQVKPVPQPSGLFRRDQPRPISMYQHIKVPASGQKITVNADMSLNVPDQPIIPFIEGDGTGMDITPVMLKVVDAAVAKAYGGKKKIHWMEVYAGEKSTRIYGPDVWLPEETLQAVKDYVVSIKGPLTTPGRWWHPFAERGACARSSICTSACAPSSISRACLRRSRSRTRPTW
jgi:hypothetical protein